MMTENLTPLKIAVFDVDRTLIVGTSGEIQLIRFLRRRKMLPLINFPRSLFWMIRKLPQDLEEAILRNKVYLYGLDVGEVRSLLPEFFENYLQPRLSLQSLKCMRELRDKGYEIILVSGTLDFILNYLVERLDAHGGVGSEMEIRDRKFTGRILGIHPFYRGKVQALEEYLNGRKVDYDRSFCFADNWADVPFLSLFGHPVVVNPGWILKIEAKKRGWGVITD